MLYNKTAPVCVFILTWLFFVILTAGFPFFWENAVFFAYDVPASNFFKVFLGTNTLLKISYMERPIEPILWTLLPKVLGFDALKHHLFKALLPAFFAALLFVIVRQYSKKLAFFAPLYFMTFTELYISTLYLQDSMLYMHLFTITALLLFFWRYKESKTSFAEWSLALLIVIFSRISVLVKHEGRIVLPIVLLFAVLCRRELFKKSSFIVLILALAVSTFPMLCFTQEKCIDEAAASDLGKTSVWQTASNFTWRFPVVVSIIGLATTILAVLNLILGVVVYKKKLSYNRQLLEIMVFSAIWLFGELLLVYAAKGFVFSLYEGNTFQRLDFAIVPFPLTLLLFTSTIFTYQALRNVLGAVPWAKIYSLFAVTFISVAILLHAVQLDDWREVWGPNFFIGWDVVREHVDSTSKNSLVVYNEPNFNVPSLFVNSTNSAVVRYIFDAKYLVSVVGNYSKVFAADRDGIPKSNVVHNCRQFSGEDRTFYDRIKKRLFGREKGRVFVLCEFNKKLIQKIVNENRQK